MNENSRQVAAVPTEAAAAAPGGSSQSDARSPLDEAKHLATIGCTDAEIADHLCCSRKALERRYARVIRRARAEGAATLREAQWSKANDGNVPMQIWLGRQMLGQAQRAAAGEEALPARVVLDLSQGP